MRVKLNYGHGLFVNISCIVLLIYANYNALIDMIFGTTLRLGIIVGALGLGFVSYIYDGFNKNDFLNKQSFLWAFFIAFIVLDNNYDLHYGTIFFTVRVIVALLLIYYSNIQTDWMTKIPKYIAIVGFPNILATLFFFFFRKSYIIMYKIYGFYPTGTQDGAAGYCAGIANHYSQNATYIAYVVISIIIITFTEKNKRKKRRWMALSMISFLALILTQKRGHLLFSFASLLAAYLILSNGSNLKKIVKTGVGGSLGIAGFYLLGKFVAPVGNLIERFSTAGTDPESMTRFQMWELCIDKFKTSPIWGIGWAHFPQEYYKNLYLPWYDDKYKFLNAHNVYCQLLCEVGFVGFTLYLSIVLYGLISTVGVLKRYSEFETFVPMKYKRVLILSVVMQLFFSMYCLTGNGLYDYSFYFYMISFSSGIAVKKKIESIINLHKVRKSKR